MNPNKSYLTQQHAAELLHISPRTLERMRVEGTGPTFLKAGRRVLYVRTDIEDWLEANSFTSTSESKAVRS